jgi:hypothetical protein
VRTSDQELGATVWQKLILSCETFREEGTYPHSLTNDPISGPSRPRGSRPHQTPNARFACLRLPRYAAAPPPANADVPTWLNRRSACDVDIGAKSVASNSWNG